MFLKKVLNQPNLVGTVLIALMVCSGFVYAFAFDGFNVETATGGEVEAWLTEAGGGGSGGDDEDPGPCDCKADHCDKCGNKTPLGTNPCGNRVKKYPCPDSDSDCRKASNPICPCRLYGSVIDICDNSSKSSCAGTCLTNPIGYEGNPGIVD